MSKYIIKNISKHYVDEYKDEHIVFKDLSIEILSEDITVILGESGCGKTTFLRIIAGLESATEGSIDYVVNNECIKPKTGFIFQESRLMPWLNVSENITFYERPKKI